MNEIEEKLWNYIDGSCSAEEKRVISLLIETDIAYQIKYGELLKLNTEFATIELDEPSMAFTYNVMEAIRTEQAKKPLKAAINPAIIKAIGIFFGATIICLLVFALGSANWSASDNHSMVRVPFALPSLKNIFSTTVLEGFICFDIVLGLFLIDGYLRKKLTKS